MSAQFGNFSIEGHTIGTGHPCFVTAEIAQTHDGSLGTAHAYIEAAARAGADAIKFQTHIAEAESTRAEPFRVEFSRQDDTRYNYWNRVAFTEEQWRGLAGHATECGLIFLSSPFSVEAVEMLERLGMAAWKVASGEIENFPLLERMAATHRPVLLSSGMMPWRALDRAVSFVREIGAPVGVFQCTTAYPCPPERLGLNVLGQLRERYHCPVGLSDHSATIYAGLAAATLGTNMLEVHVAFSRECFGPDVVASVTTTELKQLIDGIRFVERALASPVDKEAVAADMADMRRIFGRSVVAAYDLDGGQRLARRDLALKKPGGGIPPAQLEGCLNRVLRRPVAADTMLLEEDFE
jgi:N,N'-diacetyllegionaminate synthase